MASRFPGSHYTSRSVLLGTTLFGGPLASRDNCLADDSSGNRDFQSLSRKQLIEELFVFAQLLRLRKIRHLGIPLLLELGIVFRG
jgi:hypothetical protein